MGWLAKKGEVGGEVDVEQSLCGTEEDRWKQARARESVCARAMYIVTKCPGLIQVKASLPCCLILLQDLQ